MGPVFRTIAENIRSFIQKEEELLKEPKQVPDAASEIFENSAKQPSPQPPDQHMIVEQHLPKDASPKQDPKPKLPFSSRQLQDALNRRSRQESRPEPTPAPEAQGQEPVEREVSMDEDIKAFEAAVGEIETPHVEQEVVPAEHTGALDLGLSSREPLSDGFFASFEEFLMQDPGKVDPDSIQGDLVNKMRLFHERRREGKEPFLHPDDVNESLRRRMNELQVLENEWYSRYRASKDAERSMLHLETEIEEKARALRELLKESRHFALLSLEVPEEQAFVLRDGERIRSLSGLRHAVARMDADTFAHHLDPRHGYNHFAEWIGSVFGDEKLAGLVRSVRTREELIALLSGYTG